MKTIFLAAGRSTRMDPISDKNLLKFGGKPFFIHMLQQARDGGLQDFTIVANAENQCTLANELQKHDFPADIVVQEVVEDGMAGGVWAGLGTMSDDEPVVVLGGNDYVETSVYANVLQKLEEGLCDGVLLAQKVSEYFPGGYLRISRNNSITSIIEKPGEGNEPSDLVNIVVHGFQSSGDLKQALEPHKKNSNDGYEKALHDLFQTKNFHALEYDGVWQAIKYPWHVLEIMQIICKKQEPLVHNSAEVSPNAVIKGGGVIIDAGVKIFDFATIQGPCYIGENVIIGQNCLVRDSIIGAESTIGFSSEIARSYLGERVFTHNTYLGDSIVDSDVNFGAFSCTANLRLDRKGVKVHIKDERIDSKREKLGAIVGSGAQIGIHAMLMPGSKIQKDDLVGPGSIVK